MPPAPLGRDALHGMLSAAGRVVIVNTSTPADTISIVAAAIVRHDSTGDARQSLTMLDLEADESEWVDPPSPVSEPPTMVEVLLRMSRNGKIVEAYASAAPADPPPARGWETGVRPQNFPADPADVLIPDLPGFVAYLIPFE